MYENPLTKEHMDRINKYFSQNLTFISPIVKTLMCKDIGIGAMATSQTITDCAKQFFNKKQNNNTDITVNFSNYNLSEKIVLSVFGLTLGILLISRFQKTYNEKQ